MLELICHHHYTWKGLPADKTPYRNDGSRINTDGAYDGAAPGSGVITFPYPNSRVLIETGPAWQPLIALKIEVLARLDPQAAPMPMLVAGHGSFQFGLVEGTLAAQFQNNTGSNNFVRGSEHFSPDHTFHPVPAHAWVKLGFHHDGFAKMRLFIDDEMVGEAVIDGGIPPVQSPGIAIGNAIDQDDRQFPGEIDEVRIWRLDPKAMKREFLGRPYTPKTARCWQKYFETIIDWMHKHPEQRKALAQRVSAARHAFIRSLFLLPESEQAKLRALLAAFGELWFLGKIDGSEMERVLCDWITLLRALGLDPSGGAASDALAAALAEMKIDPHALLTCDPKIAKLLELLGKAAENGGKTTEVAP